MTVYQLADLKLSDFLKPYLKNDYCTMMEKYAKLVVANPVDKYIDSINK